jgi:hypothetical protein
LGPSFYNSIVQTPSHIQNFQSFISLAENRFDLEARDLFPQSGFLQLTSHYSFAGKLAGEHPWREQYHHLSLAAASGRIGLPFSK